MSIDALFKQYFYAVVFAFIALAAYFQAAGVSHLVAAELAVGSGPTFEPMPRVDVQAVPTPAARAIHERNPFDSVTGSLIPDPADEAEQKKEVTFDNPLTVPACPGVKVHILTESDDPLWSFAAMQGPGDQSPVLRRVGDKVGDMTVAYMGYNPASASPTVWLEGDTLCQSSLFGTEPVAQAAPSPEEEEKEDPNKDRGKRNSRAVDPDIANKIKKVSDTEFIIDRSAVDQILENQAELMRSARIVPEQKDGKVVGVRLFGVRPETLLGTLGFTNGDRLESINGFNMGSPEKALEAYARLRTANNLKVQLNRRGKPVTIEMKVK